VGVEKAYLPYPAYTIEKFLGEKPGRKRRRNPGWLDSPRRLASAGLRNSGGNYRSDYHRTSQAVTRTPWVSWTVI
jgi:hypothetical protein